MDLKPNVPSLLRKREAIEHIWRSTRHKLHVTHDMVSRLGLEGELEGHTGCVNCLEWNSKGNILASASDDVQVILWDPHRHKLLKTISTGHQGNIFSVKFMPESGDQTIVTGAADSKIRVHNVLMSEITHVCSCHMNRVKRIATAPTCPNLFWSASEDGTIMQFDLRSPHTCNSGTSACILVNLLNHLGQGAEAKCLAVSPTRPELLAIGANDPYVRLYDRRMIKTTTVQYPDNAIPRTSWERHFYLATRAGEGDPEENIPQGAVKYFVPGHLPPKAQDRTSRFRGMASTYLTFSSDGNELLVNLGGEQIYIFNINNQRRPLRFEIPEVSAKEETEVVTKINGFSNSKSHSEPHVKEKLPPVIEQLKLCANEAFEEKLYMKAVNLYSEAVARLPGCALLYGNRAAALMKRGWEGDVYAAIRDCQTALKLDPKHMKAQFRLARCLLELERPKEAEVCLTLFTTRYPEHSQSHSCRALNKDIQKALDLMKEQELHDEEKADGEGGSESGSNALPGTSELEMIWRAEASDYELRFCGHCNTTTDIKEANFFGSEGQFIIAGSDDGSFFIWDRCTGNIVRVLRGDDSIVNCLQPHPTTCLLATSGIDPVVRLWNPRPEDGESNEREVTDANLAATLNQKRMRADPFEVMLMNMGYRVNAGAQGGEGEEGEASPDVNTINCRTS